jgi:serine/threonine-protein kinase
MYKKRKQSKLTIGISLYFAVSLITLIVSFSIAMALLYVPLQATAQQTKISTTISSSSSSSQANITNTIDTFLTYQNSTEGIKIQYPANWEKVKNASIPQFAVLFLSPQENSSDIFRERVVVQAINLPSRNTTLDELVNELVGNLKTRLVNFELQDSKPFTIASNNTAQMLIYTYSNFLPDFRTLKSTDVAMINDNKAYIITYNAEASKYSSYLPTVQKMIESFEIIK